MKSTDISQLFGVPFGAQADSTTIAAIPATKTAIGRASMALGFPKENFQPLDNGGQPVSGADLNGILNTLARSAQAAELGVLHPFSASYAEAIGGYPSGSTIAHPSIAGRFLICTEDGNENDPSQNMAGWSDPLAGVLTRAALASYATTSDLNTETQRAEQAEAGLLPLAGGQLTGNLLGNLGASYPQVLGQTGRVVIQCFYVTRNNGGINQIFFPVPFSTTNGLNIQVTAVSTNGMDRNAENGVPYVSSPFTTYNYASTTTYFYLNASYPGRVDGYYITAMGVI